MERSVEPGKSHAIYTYTEEEFKRRLGIKEAAWITRVRTAGFDSPGKIQVIVRADSDE
jgi:hypothetical protein